MDDYEQQKKEMSVINICAYPSYFQSTSYLDHGKVKLKVYKEIKKFAKENDINIRIVEPDGRGGGSGGGAGELLFHLLDNKELILGILVVFKNFTKIIRALIADMMPINHNDLEETVIYIESFISLEKSYEDDIDTGSAVANYANSVKFMNELVRKLSSIFSIYQIQLRHYLYYNPTRSAFSYEQLGFLDKRSVDGLKAAISRSLLVPMMQSDFGTKKGLIVYRNDYYSSEYHGIHKKNCRFYIFPSIKDVLIKDFIKKIIIEWRTSKKYNGAQYR